MTTPIAATAATDEQVAERLARLQQRRQSNTSVTSTLSPPRRTGRHPAARARAAALLMTVGSVGGLGALFAGLNSAPTTVQALAAAPNVAAGGAGTAATSASPQGFDGPVINTKYGPVQVQARITNGAITDVAVITYPDKDNKSRNINARALPQLRTEVLAAQAASVDTVSGATYTSAAYRQSLQAALDSARSVGATTIA